MRMYLLCCVVLLYACSGGEESESEGHVWQDQTDAIDKARDVEDVLGSASDRQRQRIEKQTQ